MHPFIAKIVLLLIQRLRWAKSFGILLWHRVLVGIGVVGQWYRQTIGFWLYKGWFVITRSFEQWKLPLDRRLIDLIGRRGTLQLLMLAMMLFLAYPHSVFYTKEPRTIYGRETLLYALAGPTDQEFEIEEISVNVAELSTPKEVRSWREGTVASEGPSAATTTIIEREPNEIAGVSMGGLALTKPTIIPGAQIPSQSGVSAAAKRGDVVYYEVQPGDVVGRIASTYGLQITTVLWANNLSERSFIRPGDKLAILPSDGLLHKVQKGDTVSKIAKLYDANQSDVIKLNKLQEDGRDIVVGETLFVPGGVKPKPLYRPPATRPRSLAGVSAPAPSVGTPAGSGYLWPAAVRHITQYFGWRHGGLDVAGPVGTAVYAAKGGRVSTAQCGWNYGYGCYIVIDHGGGIQTLYGHNSQLYVNVGNEVVQGQTIAAMGSTGRSSGPHVHFEVRVNGGRQNPLRYIR